MYADVAVSVVVAVSVGLSCKPGWAGTWHNWTLGPVMGASVVAVLYGRGRERCVIPLVLMAAYAGPLRGDLSTATGTNAVLSSAVAIVAYTFAAAFVAARLRASAVESDRATAEAIAARGSRRGWRNVFVSTTCCTPTSSPL